MEIRLSSFAFCNKTIDEYHFAYNRRRVFNERKTHRRRSDPPFQAERVARIAGISDSTFDLFATFENELLPPDVGRGNPRDVVKKIVRASSYLQ